MLKNFFKAGFGGAGAQAINFLALPIIARLYAPEEYAIWAIVMATAGILGSIACFRYELAIVIPKSEEEASSVFWWCIFLAITLGALFFMAVQIPWLQKFIADQDGPTWLYTLFSPILVTAMGISFALQYWNVRQRAFTINSICQMGLAFVTLSVQYFYAVNVSASSTGLLVGSLAGQIALIVVCLGGYRYVTKPKLSIIILKKIPDFAIKHHRFFLYSTPYTLFGMLRSRASLFILDYFLSSREVGLYAFAYRIMNFPVSLFSSALRPVLFKETAELGVKALEGKINHILKVMTIFGTPVMVCYFFFADDLFRLFFGAQWAGSGLMGKFIILPVFTFMFCNWMDRIMDVLGQQRLVLFLEIFFASASIIGLWLGFVLHGGLYVALLVQCVILIIYNLCYLVMAYEKAGYDKKPFGHLVIIMCVLTLSTTVILTAIK